MALSIDRYLSGEVLIGEDFTEEETAQWFADEREATVEIRGAKWNYAYHAMNSFYAYEKLPDRGFSKVLSFGGGDGAELLPIRERLGEITIVEPSENIRPVVEARYIAPSVDGSIPFSDNTFDLVTCLSVLHHVSNVSMVINELYRCTAEGGFLLYTDPIVSMGDWRKPRVGLSKHERGIPLHILRSLLRSAGFQTISECKCMFAPIMYIGRKLKIEAYNSRMIVRLDSILSKLPFWCAKYHAEKVLDKFRPIGVFYVLRK
jgi:SAM-dependent methyltransferase